MLEETYVKEFDKENERVIISFEGYKEDINELRDFALVINSTKYATESNGCYEFNDDQLKEVEEIKECEYIGELLQNIYDRLEEDKDSEPCVCNAIDDEDLVNHPSHYTNSGMECILEMVMLYGFEETMSFCKLNCHKYRKRALDKGGRMDIDKSNWYIDTYKNLSVALETGMTPLQYVLNEMNLIYN